MTGASTADTSATRPSPGLVWPYPALCLLWRAGLGGRTLAPAAQDALLALGQSLTADGRDAPSWLAAVLRRSPLARLAPDAWRARAAAATASLLVSAGPTGRDPCPALLAGTLACLLPSAGKVRVPAASPVWDPATWTIVDLFADAWEDAAVTFVGPDRAHLFAVAGTRRLARRHGWPRRRALACGRTAFRIWRHWWATRESPRVRRLAQLSPPEPLGRLGVDTPLAYRRCRAALRRRLDDHVVAILPADYRGLLAREAAQSVAELSPPVTAAWPAADAVRAALAAALAVSPLGIAAAGAATAVLRRALDATAQAVLEGMTAPWPWAPRPVVRGPRRRWIERRRRRSGR